MSVKRPTTKRVRKRVKKSGIVYFAVNNRVPNMVKIGMTIDSAEKRLEYANKRNEFMPGVWSITQKVKTNDTKRTESVAHTLFEEYFDNDSISREMYFLPEGMTVKQMADIVREKDRISAELAEKEEEAKAAVKAAQAKLERLHKENKEKLTAGVVPPRKG